MIEVDNDLRFTDFFLPSTQRGQRHSEEICIILAAIMALAYNVGPYNMARLIENISYDQIKRVTDWQLLEEGQRSALAQVVNALSNLAITQYWGTGKASSSDGQRFPYRRKSLHRTYSHKLSDFAIEFYSFVADNYALYYSLPIAYTDTESARAAQRGTGSCLS